MTAWRLRQARARVGVRVRVRASLGYLPVLVFKLPVSGPFLCGVVWCGKVRPTMRL